MYKTKGIFEKRRKTEKKWESGKSKRLQQRKISENWLKSPYMIISFFLVVSYNVHVKWERRTEVRIPHATTEPWKVQTTDWPAKTQHVRTWSNPRSRETQDYVSRERGSIAMDETRLSLKIKKAQKSLNERLWKYAVMDVIVLNSSWAVLIVWANCTLKN